MIDLRFVPIPRPAKGVGIKNAQFRAKYLQTLDLLEAELAKLGAKMVTIQAGYKREDIRNDGWPRASAKPEHPACVLQFKDRKGQQLAFRALKYTTFEDNLRAIAMTLEALRAVDRYGVVEGEQYAGFKQLPAAAETSSSMNRQDAAAWVARKLGVEQPYIFNAQYVFVEELCLPLKKRFHPDANGGQDEDFKTLQVALRALRSTT